MIINKLKMHPTGLPTFKKYFSRFGGVAGWNGYHLCLPIRISGLKSHQWQFFLLLFFIFYFLQRKMKTSSAVFKELWLFSRNKKMARSIFKRDGLNPLLSEKTFKSSFLEANGLFLRIKKQWPFTTSRCFMTRKQTSSRRRRVC